MYRGTMGMEFLLSAILSVFIIELELISLKRPAPTEMVILHHQR